jgi:hypothetical protein
MTTRTRFLLLAAALAAASAACGPATVRPTSYPDPEVPCPGGRSTWSLQIIDHRAERTATDRMVHDVRDAIEKSFPGCKWTSSEGGDTIAIEVIRLASRYSDGGWDAAAEWNVTVRSAQGGTLTEFAANEEASSPNYSGRDNEKETLSEAFRKAVEKTAKGLRGVSAAENSRPRPGTPAAASASNVGGSPRSNSRSDSDLVRARNTPRFAPAWNGSRTRWLAEVL